jgi:hypothetical protein
MSTTELLLAGKVDHDLMVKRSVLFGMISQGMFAEKNNLLYVVLKTVKRYPGISNNMITFHLGKRFPYSLESINQMLSALQTDVTGNPPILRQRQNRPQARKPSKVFYDINNKELLDEWTTKLENENCTLLLINTVINDLEFRKGSVNV